MHRFSLLHGVMAVATMLPFATAALAAD